MNVDLKMKYLIDVDTISIEEETALCESDIANFFDDMLSYFRYHNKNLTKAQEYFIDDLNIIVDNVKIQKVD